MDVICNKTYKLRTNLCGYVFITLGNRSTLRGNVALNCGITLYVATLCNITWTLGIGIVSSIQRVLLIASTTLSVFCSEVITLSDIQGHDDEHVAMS